MTGLFVGNFLSCLSGSVGHWSRRGRFPRARSPNFGRRETARHGQRLEKGKRGKGLRCHRWRRVPGNEVAITRAIRYDTVSIYQSLSWPSTQQGVEPILWSDGSGHGSPIADLTRLPVAFPSQVENSVSTQKYTLIAKIVKGRQEPRFLIGLVYGQSHLLRLLRGA